MDWLVPYYCAAVLGASRILMTSWVWPGPPRGTLEQADCAICGAALHPQAYGATPVEKPVG